jgi:hypothetical protein
MAKAAESSGISDWGTPDPRNVDAYPKATSLTPMTQWAWEFLRRRSDYRSMWENRVAPFLNGRGGFDELAIERHHKELTARARREQRGCRWQAPWLALQNRFQVSGDSAFCNITLDPRLERPPEFDGSVIPEVLFTDWVDPPKVLLEFDVQLPLELQLENARRLLTRRRDRLNEPANYRLPIDKFPRYLRLLDFDAENARDREIGVHLFPYYSGEKLRDAIRKTLTAASRWQDNYLIIALHPSDAS